MSKGKPIKNYQEQSKKAEYAYKYYLNIGYTPEQSSAIVGNLVRESGLNPSAVGDNGKAFGLAQWHPDRQAKAKQLYGEKWTDFDNQLAFVHWELNNTEKSAGDKLKKSKSVWEAGKVFTDEYERPKVKFNADDKRQQHITDIYRNYSKLSLTPEDESMFRKSIYNTQVAPYMSIQSNNISILPETEINSTFAIPQVEIDYLNQLEQQTQVPQQTEVPQVTPQEDNFMQDLLAEISKGVEYVKPVQRDIMQSGGKIPVSPYGMYEFPSQPVIVPTNGAITMKNIPHKIEAKSLETGEVKMLNPNEDYFFKNTKNVLEVPIK